MAKARVSLTRQARIKRYKEKMQQKSVAIK